MKTILLIMRNTEYLASLSRQLLRKGFRVIAKQDRASALSQMRAENKVDLVISDYRMPDMDAVNFIIELKRISQVPPPVIFLSDRVNITDYLSGLSLGAFEFAFTPIHPGELQRIVQIAIQAGANKRVAPAGQLHREGPGNSIPQVPRAVFKQIKIDPDLQT